jgi:hypothetical protein
LTLRISLQVLPQLDSVVIRGWLHKRKKGAKSKTFDRRYVIFNPKDNSLKYFPRSFRTQALPAAAAAAAACS